MMIATYRATTRGTLSDLEDLFLLTDAHSVDVAHALDGEQPRLAGRDVGELLERRDGAVVVHLHAVEQRGGRAPGSHARELVAHGLDRLLHPVGPVLDQLFEQPLAHVVATTVPTRSPH